MTNTEAFEAMLTHHRTLVEHVGIRVAALTRAVVAGLPYEAAAAELVAYLADEVLPHALAEEQTIYRVAGILAQLLVQMQRPTELAREAPFTEDELAPGPEAVAKVDHRTGSAG